MTLGSPVSPYQDTMLTMAMPSSGLQQTKPSLRSASQLKPGTLGQTSTHDRCSVAEPM
jgi:hypothetical protein